MIKKFLTTLLLVNILFVLLSNPVDPQRAKTIGVNFLNSYSSSLISDSDLELTLNRADLSHCYIFNISEGGFVIVSSEDRTIPVLGYSFDGFLDVQNLSPNLIEILNGYQQQIQYVIDHDIAGNEQISQQWETLGSVFRSERAVVVSPLIQTNWGQGAYYNSLCPLDPSVSYSYQGHVPAGCVAITMAQLCKFWSYPEHGFGNHGYNANFASSGYGNYGWQFADFANTTYSYSLMPNQLSSSSSTAQVNAVATLIYHCGVSVEMKYGPTGSGAISLGSDVSAESAFKTYFGYLSTIGHYRDYYTTTEWKNLIKADLDLGRPVYYAASDPNYGGHAFVCDGYNDADYFHFNWGWTGSQNGYFTVDNLNPSSYNFSQSHRLLTGIYPSAQIEATPNNLDFYAYSGDLSIPQTIVVQGYNLATPITATTNNSQYQLSLDQTTWSNSIALPATGDTLYIRFAPNTSTNIFSTITFSAQDASPVTVQLHGYACDVVMDFPWSEGFEGNNIPDCWRQEFIVGNHQWDIKEGNPYGVPTEAHGGQQYANFSTIGYGTYGYTSRLITPEFDFSSLLSSTLYFWHLQDGYDTTYQDQLKVYCRVSSSSEWILLQTYTDSIHDWQLDSLTLPNLSAHYSIAFEGIFHWGNGIQLDDISIQIENLPVVSYILVDTLPLYFSTTTHLPTFPQTLGIAGVNLNSPITVVADAPFEITSSTVWHQAENINGSGFIDIRYSPTQAGNDTGYLHITATGLNEIKIPLLGVANPNAYTIFVAHNAGGTVDPGVSTSVFEGSSLVFTITPDQDFLISSLLIDDVECEPVNHYVFENVTSDHTLFVHFEEGVSITTLPSTHTVFVYPNPSEGVIFLESQQQIINATLHNSVGASVLNKKIGSRSSFIDATLLPAGLYFLSIETSEYMITKKVMINKQQ
ncbi:MAG: C10 family peptidase [Bacteroidales bacterium]|jgi:hypothetical protein|nr:C10 family peptidase [Bacteroidales bacterium]